MNKSLTVDEYITNAPEEFQQKLKQLRQVIKECVPQAEEKISYGMPYYGYKGRLAYFALAKSHLGLYIPPPVIENHKSELKKYVTAKATIQFPLDQDLPLPLIKKLIKARANINQTEK
jgi:uncharacterized protein YdhG (YjbR/CyaY superfamily)